MSRVTKMFILSHRKKVYYTMNIYEWLTNQKTRKILCRQSLYLFGIYYFREYFTHVSPEFHKEKCRIIQKLWKHWEPRFLVDCEFRWSAKSSWGKIDFIRRICYWDSKYMLYGSLDKNIAADALLDISLELQTNERIIKDFWQLFFDTEKNKSKKTWVTNFLTSNWIRVQALTTWQPIRWKLFKWIRPDYIVYDDFENNQTKVSAALTRQVKSHFDEMFGAVAPYWIVIFYCNKISDTWSVAWLYDKFEDNREGIIFEKAVIEKDEITWKSKYVMTDKESDEINVKIDKLKWVISLESVKKTMNKDGRKLFEQEMLNMPLVDWERFFDVEMIDDRIQYLKDREYRKEWNWRIWEEYNWLDEYCIAADVSEWYWLDSSVIEVINQKTWEQVWEFESNQIPPWLLADELIDCSENYWDARLTPERNSIWNAVITSIQEKWFWSLLTTQKVINKKWWWTENRYWWYTNSTSKSKMLFDFQRDFNDGSLIINSLPLLREMRWFANWDLKASNFDEEQTNHFDRVMAMAIANQSRSMVNSFAIDKKSINIGEKWAVTSMDLQFRGGRWRGNFKH